jgi:chemotaxis protein MotB
MNESQQPFTDHVTRKSNSSKSAWIAWVIAIVMAAAAGTLLFFWNAANVRQQQALDALQNTSAGLKSDLATARAQNQTNLELIASLTNQIADLQKAKEAVTHASKSLEDEMRSQLESKDVTISKLQGKLTVNIVDRVMFDSGEAVLKPDGEVVMRKIATILQEHPQLAIHVIGHTDNVPISPKAQSRFASNWELSTARALAAVHFLTERAGVDPKRVGAVGYGEFRPVADNATAEGRAKNRRIAITILPEELIPTDALPIAKPNDGTNSALSAPMPN